MNHRIALALVLLAACARTEVTPTGESSSVSEVSPQPAALPSDDVLVLRVVLAPHCGASDGKYRVLPGEVGDLSWLTPSPSVDSAAVANLRRRNASKPRLPEGLDCTGVHRVSYKDIDAAFANRPSDSNPLHLGWEGFYAQYPDASGLLTVSLPGYSPDRSTAVVAVTASSGLRSGSGAILVLRKHEGVWKLVDLHMTVVS